MSQVVTLKRTISGEQLAEALEDHPELRIAKKHDGGFQLAYGPDTQAHIVFHNGELETTSPSEDLFLELEKLAQRLGAEMVLEEDEPVPPRDCGKVREFVLFWPVLCAVLLAMLIWRW